MQIRRLKLSGFKSFVEPAELRIEHGLTGVVGPNGCGKSNLLEAIRWVMGEASAKSLRGGGMEDVIFAGTAQRPARDFAEVVLHASTDDESDLEVVRRIERGAGSAYRVNGRDVRAKDVALVFADAATGAHSPALVSQGRIAAVIAAKPAERRQMLEEAAGISGLHVRRKDAEQKLRATENNLSRLQDILSTLDSQIATLRRQARAAERYTALSDKIRLSEARVIYSRWRDAAAAAESARVEAQAAVDAVEAAQTAANQAQKDQHSVAAAHAMARDTLADRRDDATAHGHRMAALTAQLEAAEQRLADLDRQAGRLEEDRRDADRLTTDAADALARLERELSDGEVQLKTDEQARPALHSAVDNAERASRQAELSLAQAMAAQATIDAEWRVAEAALSAAQARLSRLDAEAQRHAQQQAALDAESDPDVALAAAQTAKNEAIAALTASSQVLDQLQVDKAELLAARDTASAALAAARADLAGVEREHVALLRDREARAKQSKAAHGLPLALDRVRAAPGYERALAAVLGRDGKAALGTPPSDTDGRFWIGADTPQAVADNLLIHVSQYPPELSARLAMVHVVDADDARILAPGEWLVTRDGRLRRWDGFISQGDGAAEAARLEAENRFAELDSILPQRQSEAAAAEAALTVVQANLSALQAEIVAADRMHSGLIEQERSALRALDRAEDARHRMSERRASLMEAFSDFQDRRKQADQELSAATARKAELPDQSTGRAELDAAQHRNDTARLALQAASTALSSHDQTLAVTRERVQRQRGDIKSWQTRSGDAAARLASLARRAEEIVEERAIIAAKPASLMKEIEAGEAIRMRLATDLTEAERALAEVSQSATAADMAFGVANEALATARERRAAISTRAQVEAERQAEMARISGERFQSPPPLLPGKLGFDADDVAPATEESAGMDRLVADRERIGPVNLVAATELTEAEERQGASAAEQAELTEAVNRLRGSIGSLNREGRERLRAAFEAVDGHFRRLFTRLFDGGQAHLALVDSDDPLEAGLEIFAQPPGKRLQSLTLLSGGEQALTAIALIFALFLTNPAPICVLDEVDAPLDDANIERFCDLLDAMSVETKTRYLIVTHNAVTMSRMHRLFGVTMVEKGVSRLVSVDLGGAEQLLAAE